MSTPSNIRKLPITDVVLYLMMMQVKKKINMMMMTVIIQHLSQNMRMFVTEILQKCSRR